VDTSFLLKGYPKDNQVHTSCLLMVYSSNLRLSHAIDTLNHSLNTVILSPRAAAIKSKTKTMEIGFICRVFRDKFTPFPAL
jgi:hypothetical protein